MVPLSSPIFLPYRDFFFFVKEKQGNKTKKRTKEEEIEKEGRRSW